MTSVFPMYANWVQCTATAAVDTAANTVAVAATNAAAAATDAVGLVGLP
jgi:hypothetical protein